VAIEDLTNQLKQLKEHGEADLQLSPAMREQWVWAIRDFRGALQAQRDKITGTGGNGENLKNLGGPGGYWSAVETRNRLLLNIDGTDGILAILDKYIDYLDEFEATVNAACKRLHGEDAITGTGEVLHA
jgi:hypothetical protein